MWEGTSLRCAFPLSLFSFFLKLTPLVSTRRSQGTLFIYFPNGSVVFYGRVSPADVRLIVDRTVVAGKVIPEFLRGGLGLAGKEGERGVVEW